MVLKFQWAKAIVGEDEKLYHVQCKICTNLKWRGKLLTPKFNGFHKHNGRRKCKHTKLRLKVVEYYNNPNTQHAKNEHVYALQALIILKQMLNVEKAKKKKNYLQFVTISHF